MGCRRRVGKDACLQWPTVKLLSTASPLSLTKLAFMPKRAAKSTPGPSKKTLLATSKSRPHTTPSKLLSTSRAPEMSTACSNVPTSLKNTAKNTKKLWPKRSKTPSMTGSSCPANTPKRPSCGSQLHTRKRNREPLPSMLLQKIQAAGKIVYASKTSTKLYQVKTPSNVG